MEEMPKLSSTDFEETKNNFVQSLQLARCFATPCRRQPARRRTRNLLNFEHFPQKHSSDRPMRSAKTLGSISP